MSSVLAVAAVLAQLSGGGGVQITTSDGRGEIALDGKVVGTGAFRGELPEGAHALVVRREGFVTHEETVRVAKGVTLVETVTLVRRPAPAAPPPSAEPFGGVYGGWALFGVLEPAGSAGAFDASCGLFGASACSSPTPGGLGVSAHVGYTWDPVGVELFGGAMFDYAEPSATFDGVVRPGSSAVLTGPARVENWRVVRYGVLGAVRARAALETRLVRASLAAGPGLAFKNVTSGRQSHTTDGTGLSDDFAPGDVSYASPALSVELAVTVRASPRFGMTAGFYLWLESAGNGVDTKPDPERAFVSPAGLVPLRTPAYRLASGTQAFVGPFVGMTFGP